MTYVIVTLLIGGLIGVVVIAIKLAVSKAEDGAEHKAHREVAEEDADARAEHDKIASKPLLVGAAAREWVRERNARKRAERQDS